MSPAFFSVDSYWNTPLPSAPPLHPDNERFKALTRRATASPGLHINLHAWTVPIYEADAASPRLPVGRRMRTEDYGRWFYANSAAYVGPGHPVGHDPSFGPTIPLPPAATPDGQTDAHLTIIDPATRTAWDMWAAHRTLGGAWEACTGNAYSLDGSGVFEPARFPIRNGESIHMYGPGRATGVPTIAGMILHDELRAGRIAHKLAYGSMASGLLAHYFPPALWTDGGVPGGLPAGLILQLDPALDLAALDLSPGARVVARALQEYGAALVDFVHGFTLYGEGLWSDPRGRSWTNGLEEDSLFALGLEHFRFLAPEATGQTMVEKGMVPLPHRGITQVYHEATGIPPRP